MMVELLKKSIEKNNNQNSSWDSFVWISFTFYQIINGYTRSFSWILLIASMATSITKLCFQTTIYLGLVSSLMNGIGYRSALRNSLRNGERNLNLHWCSRIRYSSLNWVVPLFQVMLMVNEDIQKYSFRVELNATYYIFQQQRHWCNMNFAFDCFMSSWAMSINYHANCNYQKGWLISDDSNEQFSVALLTFFV